MQKRIMLLAMFTTICVSPLLSKSITRQLLVNNSFSSYSAMHGDVLKFHNNMRYQYKIDLPGSNRSVSGYYKIKNNKVYLFPTKYGQKFRTYLPRKAVGFLKYDPNALYYSYSLVIKNFKKTDSNNIFQFDLLPSKVQAGLKRYYNKIAVITMGQKKGITTSNVKIRKGPSIKAKAVKFMPNPMGATEAMKYVPKNFNVRIIARTTKKQRVFKWYNYWYLVDIQFQYRVWMFAEFVKIKK